MNYQELRKNSQTLSHTAKIEVLEYENVCYKLFDKSFDMTRIFYEAMLQTMAEESGIRVPKIYGVEQVDDRCAILSEYIEGETILQLMDENPAKRDYYLNILADTQIDINSRTVTDIKNLRRKMREEINSLDMLDELKKYELETHLASMPEHNKLCHGNFGPENVIIDEMDKVVVLDWAAAAGGNAGADTARTYLKLTLISTEAAEKYISLFCEKTGFDKRYVYEWTPIAAACALSEKGLSENEKAVLCSWTDVFGSANGASPNLREDF